MSEVEQDQELQTREAREFLGSTKDQSFDQVSIAVASPDVIRSCRAAR